MDPSFPKPLLSTRAGDPAFDERIDRFVIELGERIDSFQDAVSAAQRATLEALAGALERDADAVGYPPLAEAARRVALACGENADEALRKSVEDLTEVAGRVRRGHRSAAS
jgi:hypothetical protein